MYLLVISSINLTTNVHSKYCEAPLWRANSARSARSAR